MRVTQFTFYNNFLLNQQQDLSELTNIQTQLSTGKKIEYMNENPVVYTKYLTLDEEINSFSQIKNSAQFAKTFANETDTTLNDITNTLTSFKTKLLQAANATQNETSREAIVSELKADLDHLRDLANTSIDGKYIFSGSAFDVKPINDDFQYQGNNKKVKAFLGSGVEREYNIDGESLFLGRDDDYKKHVTLNVVQYNKMKQHPEFVVRGNDGKLYIDKNIKEHGKIPDSQNPPENTPITVDSEIRMLTGVSDIYDSSTDTYKDGTSYFYIRGKKPDGEVINTKFSLSNSAKVSDLLKKIGEVYGNTATNKVVDVSLNSMGEIQIKDVNSGKMLTDFFMVASDKDEPTLEDLVKNGDYIVKFQDSDYASVPLISEAKANNGYFDNRIYKFGVVFKRISDHQDALPQDKIIDTLGDVNLSVSINGATYSVGPDQTYKDLLDKINNSGEYDAYLKNGELIIEDKNVSNSNDTSNLNISMETTSAANGYPVAALTPSDAVNFNKLYFDKKENLVISNTSQIVADSKYIKKDGEWLFEKNDNAQHYATLDTVLADTIDLPPDKYPQTINLQYRDINGDYKTATITLRDTPENGHLSTFTVDGKTYDILDQNGNPTPAHDIITTQTSIDPTTCKICKKENIQKGVTFKQLSDVVSMILTDKLPSSNEDYDEAVKEAHKEVVAGIDNKGRFFVKDLENQPSKIQLSMYGDNFSFQENNAITIDSPQTDFFGTLQKAIEAVENGNEYANANSKDPRNFGIQGALEAIEHVMDRVRREHAKIGAVSQEFDMSIQRVTMLTTHVQVLQSDNIDTDIGDATMKLNSLELSYQALLASIAKVNNLTLLNYLR